MASAPSVDTVKPPRRSPFYRVQSELGATFMEEAGWLWTKGFGDLEAEYRAVREDLGIWDVSPLNKWEFRGPDALPAASRLHTNDIPRLAVGQVRYGAFCDPDGLMIDDGTVFRLADGHVWVMTNGGDHAAHFAGVTKGLNVSIEYIAPQLPHVGLQGPRARQALAPLCSIDLNGLRYYRFIPEPVKVAGVPCWVSRTGFGGELGYELFCRPEDAEDLWAALTEKTGARPFGVEAIEILRIEAGLIILDYDYEAHQRIPYDFSMDRFVALDRADFTGKGALVELARNPPRRFKTLLLSGDRLPEYRVAVTKEGEPAGTLTSPTKSPRFGPIGLAVLESRFAKDGETLDVACADGTLPARVEKLSIYDPEKRRPRS